MSVILLVMTIIQAIILGAIQGLTEFIPVSSSGHLLVASELFGIPTSFETETLLNIGTLLAATIYFRKDLLGSMLDKQKNFRLLKLLALGSLPLYVGGVLFDFTLEQLLRSPVVVIVMLISVGFLMINSKPGERDLKSANTTDALVVGASQIIALIPGTSRSGITMLSGMKNGFSAETAARFSFLLSIPAVAGAIVYTFFDLWTEGTLASEPVAVLVAGNIAAFVTSLLAIHGMITFLKKSGLKAFGWYRIGLGVILTLVLVT